MRWTASVVGYAMLALLPATPAVAAPYWVAWEGNDFPESEGWTRSVNGVQPAERSLVEGFLRLDGLADRQIDDAYRILGSQDPAPGEVFLMQWRVRVNEAFGGLLRDPGVAVFSSDDWGLGFQFGVDHVMSAFENIAAPYAPSTFHAFELRSSDMRSYTLWIDGALALSGSFWEPAVTRSRIGWGDLTLGSASSSDWDYVRFGVVPEPATGAFSVAVCCAIARLRRHIL